MNTTELKEMAQTFQKANPRFMSLDVMHYAVKNQTGYNLTAQDFTIFLNYKGL